MEAFDVFVRSYESGLPLLTLTVSSSTTVNKLKKLFSEQSNPPLLNIVGDKTFYYEK